MIDSGIAGRIDNGAMTGVFFIARGEAEPDKRRYANRGKEFFHIVVVSVQDSAY
jgi:hypothetical protein